MVGEYILTALRYWVVGMRPMSGGLESRLPLPVPNWADRTAKRLACVIHEGEGAPHFTPCSMRAPSPLPFVCRGHRRGLSGALQSIRGVSPRMMYASQARSRIFDAAQP